MVNIQEQIKTIHILTDMKKTNEISRDIVNADFTFGYDLTKWLKATLRSGVDFYNEKQDS